jgi:cytochrome c peroxidase
MANVDGVERLLVANRKSGSITVIDTAQRYVLAEHNVGLGLVDLVALPDHIHFLALDQAGNDLLLLEARAESILVLARVHVCRDPVGVSLSRDGLSCVVASRWSRRLTFLDLMGARERVVPSPRIAGTLNLPFFPRELIRSTDGSVLLVADAFGGKLALVNLQGYSLRSVHNLPGHNIRGLAMGPGGSSLLVAHQSLNPLARSTFDDVHWGLLINNQLHELPWAAILSGVTGSPKGTRVHELGNVGQGAADPSNLIVDSKGRVIVALGGVNEVMIIKGPGERPRRVPVGHRPVAMTPSADAQLVYVANTLDDTISVVALGPSQRLATIPLGPQPKLSLVDRGEQLFHDARLSHDGWMSCHSCHTDGHTSGLLGDTLGDGSYGAPKKIPSLLGVGSTGPWNWTGSVPRLEDQVRKSIVTTMHGSETTATDVDVRALTAYLRSLAPFSSNQVEENRTESSKIARGREVFSVRRCGACHVPPEYTSPAVFDVGLTDEVGNSRFNPPSLRGVAFREPLLHDGRATTLEDLFQRHRHPRETYLTQPEIADLVAFLKSL